MTTSKNPYAAERTVKDTKDCFFYHTMDLPGLGVVKGDWDLRGNVDTYIGNVDLKGKRVLEFGTANGFLCFEMEKRGAEVVALDLSANDDFDLIPYGGSMPRGDKKHRVEHNNQLNNAWWLAHRLFKSKARVVYGPVYNVPVEDIGPVQVSTFGSILLHLRDPFLVLQKAASITTESIIVTDMVPGTFKEQFLSMVPALAGYRSLFGRRYKPMVYFLPDPVTQMPRDAWWWLTPDTVCRFLKVLGFPNVTVTYHRQKHKGIAPRLYTVVGRK